jgi:hypothetical protein
MNIVSWKMLYSMEFTWLVGLVRFRKSVTGNVVVPFSEAANWLPVLKVVKKSRQPSKGEGPHGCSDGGELGSEHGNCETWGQCSVPTAATPDESNLVMELRMAVPFS